MKIVIPSTLKILAHEHKIVLSDTVCRMAGDRGNVDYTTQTIRLSIKRPDTQKLDVLIHETIETVEHHLVLGITHEIILALSPILSLILQTAGFEPDFSQIPKEE